MLLRPIPTWSFYSVRWLRAALAPLLMLLIPAATHAHPQRRPAQVSTCPASIVYGELVQCTISSGGELDSYAFSASAGDELLVRAGAASSNLGLSIRVLTAAGATVCRNTSLYTPVVELTPCTIGVSGAYRVEVGAAQSTQTGSYGLHVERLNPPANARPLSLAQTTTGAILSAAQLDSYSFSANSGDRLVLRMGVSSGALRPLLRLYDAAGRKVCEGGAPYAPMGEIEGCIVTASGSYTLIVADYGNVRTGSYGLHVQRTNAPVGSVALPIAQSNVAAILSAGELDTYTLTTDAGGPMLLRIAVANGTLRPYLRLYGAEGALICSAGSPYSALGEISSCLLPQAGAYTLLVSDYGDVRTGTYHLFWQSLTQPINAAALSIGQHTLGTLATPGQLTTYRFSATAGSAMIFRMGASSGALRPYLRLYTAQGAKLCEAGYSYSDTAESPVCALTDGGTYTLILSDYGDVRTGGYGVMVQRFNGPVGAASLRAGQAVNTTIAAAGEFDSYTFTANAGDQLALRMGVTSGTLRPHLRVYTAGGAKLCEAGSSYATLVEIDGCVAPETGQYVVLANDYGGSRSGAYMALFQNLTSPGLPALRYGYLPLARR